MKTKIVSCALLLLISGCSSQYSALSNKYEDQAYNQCEKIKLEKKLTPESQPNCAIEAFRASVTAEKFYTLVEKTDKEACKEKYSAPEEIKACLLEKRETFYKDTTAEYINSMKENLEKLISSQQK